MLAKKLRLKSISEFKYVYKKGSSASTKCFVFLFAKSKYETTKIGFVVSKKNGGAVTRNRIKRKMRAAFEPLVSIIPKHYNFIFIARNEILSCSVEKISEMMKNTLLKNNLI